LSGIDSLPDGQLHLTPVLLPLAGPTAEDQVSRPLALDWVAWLLGRCLEAGPALEGLQVALLRLLAVWVAGCQPAAHLLLKSTNLFIVELISTAIKPNGKGPERGKPLPLSGRG
jgi:hypothetical protein